jgi:hypothetical protein
MDEPDYRYGYIDDLISRARAAPEGTTQEDIIKSLVLSGVEPEDAYLAVKAAGLLD